MGIAIGHQVNFKNRSKLNVFKLQKKMTCKKLEYELLLQPILSRKGKVKEDKLTPVRYSSPIGLLSEKKAIVT